MGQSAEHRWKQRHFVRAVGAPHGERQSSLVSNCISHFPGCTPSHYRLGASRSAAVVLAYARRQTRLQLIQAASTLPAISYAVPGTVLAIGLLIPLAGLDNGIDEVMRSLFGVSTGLLLSGTAFAIVLGYTIRFLAASLGAVEAGLARVSRNIDAAARTLGATISEALVKVHLPLLR